MRLRRPRLPHLLQYADGLVLVAEPKLDDEEIQARLKAHEEHATEEERATPRDLVQVLAYSHLDLPGDLGAQESLP